ncbi:MAG: helix-turn-helix domain-containing protein [Treponema sp.]|nr:helix-turn-helix domain-containing protein [Treponema sp.]
MKENKGFAQNRSLSEQAGIWSTNEDLMEKAEKIMFDYNQATGSNICLCDSSLKPQFPSRCDSDNSPEKKICPFCKKGNMQGSTPCHDMHTNAIREAGRKGCCHIYNCYMGLLFWTSPIYTEGAFSGAIRGSGFLTEKQKTVDIFLNANDTFVMCNSEIPNEEFKERIISLPEADGEKVQSLGEMMQLCAESLSSGSEDYHETIKRRAQQQETISKMIEDLKQQYPNPDKPDKLGYPLEKEKTLLNSLRKGEGFEAKKTLNELLAMLFFTNPGQFKYVQLRVIELVVLISRVEVSPVQSGNLSMEINSQNLRLVQEAKTIEELTDILHNIVDRVSGTISSFRGIPHAAALRKAENFIMENFTRKISLKEISAVAGLSPPYFSTIFKEEMGENLSKYLNRLRVEKASRLLLDTEMSLSEIASCCCFEDQSWFSKIFKAYTGISPGKYRNQGGGIIRNIGDNNLSEDLRKTAK